MTPELAAFSDWALALLPRLFLYPGGLWMLGGLLVMRYVPRLSAYRPTSMLHELAKANLPALATAWAALSLLPMPAAAPLPTPVDGLTLAALLALSMILDINNGEVDRQQALVGVGVTLALSTPAVMSRSLLAQSIEWSVPMALSILAVGVGLVALNRTGGRSLSGDVRLLTWLCVGLLPLWSRLNSAALTTLVIFAAVAALQFMFRKRLQSERTARWATFTLWLLATAGLLAALLGLG